MKIIAYSFPNYRLFPLDSFAFITYNKAYIFHIAPTRRNKMKKATHLTKEYRYTFFVLTIELFVSISQALPLFTSAA